MKRFTAVIVLLVTVTSLLLTACGGNGHTATDLPPESSGTNADTSSDTSTDASADNSDQSGEEAEPLYKGDVYLESLDLPFYGYNMTLVHSSSRVAAELPLTLKVLNKGKWQVAQKEFDIEKAAYAVTVGEDTLYYNNLLNYFYDPKRNMIVYARQSSLDITANEINAELDHFKPEYLLPYLPELPKLEESKLIHGTSFDFNATGYEIETTVEKNIKAKKMEVNPAYEVVAVYDGKFTHFINYTNGEILFTQEDMFLGKACNNGGFKKGDVDAIDGDGNEDVCVFFESKHDILQAAVEEDHWHEGGERLPTPYYSEDKKTAYYVHIGQRYLYNKYGFCALNNYVPCQYAEINKNLDHAILKLEDIVNLDTVGKYGVVFGGEAVIPFEFDLIDTYQGGNTRYGIDEPRLGVFRAIKDGKTYYYSTNGTNLTPDGFVCGTQPRENRATVYDGKKIYVIKFTTEEKFNPEDIFVATDNGIGAVKLDSAMNQLVYDEITSDNWTDGGTDCLYDYAFYFGDKLYLYHSDCGVLTFGHTSFKILSEEKRNKINEHLDIDYEKPVPDVLPPSEELYGGHLYIYTSYATYYDIEKHDQSGTHNKAVSQIMLNADWQEGEKSSEEYHYYIE
ncbi:MAG: hypothetical protein IKU23_05195, partial [Clostridia bacterium]|nr:hypothetical protein [Clostridia bacterium]